jgi:hypothetical protein
MNTYTVTDFDGKVEYVNAVGWGITPAGDLIFSDSPNQAPKLAFAHGNWAKVCLSPIQHGKAS